jgi:four helix bundle protein
MRECEKSKRDWEPVMNENYVVTHKDLEIWKLGIEMVEYVYRITAGFPKEEQFGLISQMRRCSVSIPSNIAEGAARQSIKEYIQFLYFSLGSLSELETHFEISRRLKFTNTSEFIEMIEKLRRKLLNFIKHCKGKLS